MISAVVLTKNEEKNILRCLDSLKWVDEIVIIDDYSEDETIKKSQSLNLKTQNQNLKLAIYKKHLKGNFAEQRNFGLEKANGDWVLFLDADEKISPELALEIKKTIARTGFKGFFLKRRDFFGGKELKYGESGKIKLLRLARKDTGNWEGRVHEIWAVRGRIGKMNNFIYHYPHQTIKEFVSEINFYSTLRAEELKKNGVKGRIIDILFYPFAKFLKIYVFKKGFLDGEQGLIVAALMSFHSFLARSKLYLLHDEN